MQNLLLITHPEVVTDKDTPITDWHLSDKGINRARSLLEQVFWHEVDAIYTSTEFKAHFVAQATSKKFRIPILLRQELAEIDRSSTGYLPYVEYMETVRRFYLNPAESIRGWETANDATNRIWNCVKGIAKAEAGETVAIIGHGAIFTLLLCRILGLPPSFELDPGKVGCLTEIDWGDRKIITPWIKY